MSINLSALSAMSQPYLDRCHPERRQTSPKMALTDVDPETAATALPTTEQFADIVKLIRDAMEADESQRERKPLPQALVAEIKVHSPDAIYPRFRLPETGVRVLIGWWESLDTFRTLLSNCRLLTPVAG
jgi:hypothetical protein